MTIFEQIRNIGSEITRARMAREHADLKSYGLALKRAIEFINSILKNESGIGRVREMNILRNVIQDKIDGTGLYDCSFKSLEEYCLPFALLARKNN